jgi:VanZ family protein
MKKNGFVVYGPTLLYMLVIFVLSSMPHLKPPSLGFRPVDKVAHALEYGVLGALLFRSAIFRYEFSVRLFIILCCIGILYGISDEIHQGFVPHRVSSVWDGAADAVGIVLGLLAARLWHMRRCFPSPFFY